VFFWGVIHSDTALRNWGYTLVATVSLDLQTKRSNHEVKAYGCDRVGSPEELYIESLSFALGFIPGFSSFLRKKLIVVDPSPSVVGGLRFLREIESRKLKVTTEISDFAIDYGKPSTLQASLRGE